MSSSSRIVPVAPLVLSIGCLKSLLIISTTAGPMSTIEEEDSLLFALKIRSCSSDSMSGGTPLICESKLASRPIREDGTKGGGCVGKRILQENL